MHKIKNKNVEIKNDNGDVVVRDNKTEFFRKPKSHQTVSIAHAIYLAEKYYDETFSDNPISGCAYWVD